MLRHIAATTVTIATRIDQAKNNGLINLNVLDALSSGNDYSGELVAAGSRWEPE
jgi:hypothetical protein